MLGDETRAKIQDITSGNVLQGQGDYCTAIRNLLCGSFETSKSVKEEFENKAISKKEQAIVLENYATEHGLWVNELPDSDRYLTRGGESRIYLDSDSRNVIKINDSVYYATWLEFFNSVLLHNLIFDNTSYTIKGFFKEDGQLHAVLKQPFIVAEASLSLSNVKAFLEFNGFASTKRHDYYHAELGLILEDMHDENVLINSGILFVIDSVFYTVLYPL